MDWIQVILNNLPVVVAMGGCFAWLWSRLDKKFDAIEKRFDAIDHKFESLSLDIRKIDSRLSKLEGQDEERFRNEIKLIVSKQTL